MYDDRINKMLRTALSDGAERENARAAFWKALEGRFGPHDLMLLRRDQADDMGQLILDMDKRIEEKDSAYLALMKERNNLQLRLMELGDSGGVEHHDQPFPDSKELLQKLRRLVQSPKTPIGQGKVKSPARFALLMKDFYDLWLSKYGSDRGFVPEAVNAIGKRISKDTVIRAKNRGRFIDPDILQAIAASGRLDKSKILEELAGPAGDRALPVDEQRAIYERYRGALLDQPRNPFVLRPVEE